MILKSLKNSIICCILVCYLVLFLQEKKLLLVMIYLISVILAIRNWLDI